MLQDSYEALLDHIEDEPETDGGENILLADGGQQDEDPTAYALFHSFGNGKNKQPVIDKLGGNQPYYLFNTLRDLEQFTREYAKQYGVTNLDDYEVVELELKRKGNAEDLLGFNGQELQAELEQEEGEPVDAEPYSKSSDQTGISEFGGDA
ncbi:hypothetical protein OB919_15835 [Halobacteria archaeon AArc-curdl1]|uniref:Uncharacterized protein n=1 Tax=Natronosalvus hydrolyticus TaxID=2979988 RepID=A0AAP2ZBD9_9EURY|nr:hypothetical protein [Halobacteria archaeon AArc-curdl1]